MHNEHAIGIDLGGTNIKAVLTDPAGKVLTRRSCETRDETLTVEDWAANIRALIDLLDRDCGRATDCVGLAAPGIPAADGRCIEFLPNKLSGLVGFNWTTGLQRNHPVPVLNDATAALLGEAWIGAAQPYPNAVLLTLGTGVGGAILRNGELMLGARGRAGHLGHLSLDPFGAKDIVNTPGSLEDWIGNHNVATRSGGRFHSTRKLVEAARTGDAEAAAVWRRSIRGLAAGIASIINALDPDAILIGGGIAAAGEDLFQPLAKELDELEWQLGAYRVPILPATLGEWAGAIGAARQSLLTAL